MEKEVTIKLDHIAKKIEQGNVVFFFGAGASKSANLPLGNDAVHWIFESVAKSIGLNHNLIQEFATKKNPPRFEKAISMAIDLSGERALSIMDIFGNALPTLSHAFIAKCAQLNLIHEHLTTNFDNLLEQLLVDLDIEYRSLYEMDHFKHLETDKFQESTKHCFHNIMLHGSTKDKHKDSSQIIATIDSILRPLPIVKDKLLEHLLRKRDVIFVGYSAWDTDIYPVLKRVKNDARYWWIARSYNERIGVLLNYSKNTFIPTTADVAFEYLFQKLFNSSYKLPQRRSEQYFKELLATVISSFGARACTKLAVDLLSIVGMHDDALNILSGVRNDDFEYWFSKTGDILYQAGNFNALKLLVEEHGDCSIGNESASSYATRARHYENAGKHEQALSFAKKGYDLALQGNHPQDIILTGVALGNVYYLRGKHHKAIEPLEQAYKAACNQPEVMASIGMTLGVIYYRMGEMEKAEMRYKNAYSIIPEITDPFLEAKCHVNMAEFYRHELRTIKQSFFHIDKARDISEEYGFESVIHHLFAIDMLASRLAGNKTRAKKVAKEAINTFRGVDNLVETHANTFLNIGLIHYDEGEYHKSINYYEKALRIYTEINQHYRLMLVESNLSQAYTKLKQYGVAKQHIASAWRHSDKCGDVENRREATCWLHIAECDLAFAIGDSEKLAESYSNGLRVAQELNLDELLSEFKMIKSLVAGIND